MDPDSVCTLQTFGRLIPEQDESTFQRNFSLPRPAARFSQAVLFGGGVVMVEATDIQNQ